MYHFFNIKNFVLKNIKFLAIFIAIGFTCSAVDYILYKIFLNLDFKINSAKLISVCIAVIINFILNSKFNFKNKIKLNVKSFICYFLVYLILIKLHVLINYKFYLIFNQIEIAYFFALCFSTILNFTTIYLIFIKYNLPSLQFSDVFMKIIIKFHFLQDLVINILSSIHPSIIHNIDKIIVIKKALFHILSENIQGSYCEFGIFKGNSLLSAIKTYNNIKETKIAEFKFDNHNMNFYGFDSFDDGFKYNGEDDKHNFFTEGGFVSCYSFCKKRFEKYQNVKLVKGYFEDTLQNKEVKNVLKEEEKCAIAFIDCDLTIPAYICLNFLKSILQAGSVIILDDFFAYKGNPKLGTSGAFARFLEENQNIKVREFFKYGINGTSFIVYEV